MLVMNRQDGDKARIVFQVQQTDLETVRNRGLTDPAEPAIYLPWTVLTPPGGTFMIRTAGDPNKVVKAIRERHVAVTIIVPGAQNDHLLTRGSSRSLYGDLLLAGARIFEYQPSMIHAKTMEVDGVWAVTGSTNLDSRSFGLNDEVNVAIPDAAVAKRLDQDFESDLRESRPVGYEQWKRRPIWEKINEWLGWLLINQQ